MIRTILIAYMTYLAAGLSLGQVTFEISPRQLPLNRNLQFRIIIEGSSHRTPSFPEGLRSDFFQLISQSPNTSFSTSIINGKMSTQKQYTYHLRPTKEGTHTFSSQKVNIDGKMYTSQPVNISVKSADAGIRSRQRSSPLDNFFKSPAQTRSRNSRQPEIFAEFSVPKKRFYIGEAIPLEVTILSYGVEIHPQRSRMEWPDMTNFWIEEPPQPNQRAATAERNGKVYHENTVGTRLLYANKAGVLTIDPVVFELLVSTGGFMADWQNVTRKTESLALTILPLPQNNKPGNFNGAVGLFSLKSEVDREELAIGETLSLKLILSGKGNFSAIQKLAVEELEKHFDVFDGGAPQTVEKNGLVNKKTWVYALVPKNEGTFTLPAVRLAYFDLKSKQYQSTSSRSYEVTVKPGNRLPEQGTPQGEYDGPVISREDESLRFIKFDQDGWTHQAQTYYSPNVLYGLAAFCLFGNLIFLAGFKVRENWLGKQEGLRPKLAFKEFRNQIKKLKKNKKPDDLFSADISAAVMTYFGSKLQRSSQGLALDEIERELEKRGADGKIYNRLVICIESCDFARFTRSSSTSNERLIDMAAEVIEQAEEVWR